MVSFSVISTVVDTNSLELLGASGLEYALFGGQDYLFVASEADGSITSFRLSANSAPTFIDTVTYSSSSGTFAVQDLSVSTVGGQLTVLPLGRLDDDVAIYHVDTNGHFSAPIQQTPSGVDIGKFYASENLTIDGKEYLFVSEWGASGIDSYRMKPDDTLKVKNSYDSNAFDYLGDVSAFASATIGDKNFLFAASAFDAGVTSFRVGQHGNLHQKDTVGPSDGNGFSLPQALETVQVAGDTYLLMASSGSNSITVYEVGKGGALTETDHRIDSVNTRFEGANVLESFNYNDRSFILGAGADDGITLLEVLPGGLLTVVSVLADDFDTTLDNVSDIKVVEIGSEVHALVSSGTEHGFTQFQLDLSDIGISVVGKKAHETLNGTEDDDVLSGMGGSDTIYGGAEDDRLIDGAGKDHLYGGAGADVFHFIEDGKKDIIHDFEIGVDRIDLSQISNASHIASVSIKSRDFGAALFVGDEEIRVETANGAALNAADFTMDDFIF